MTAKEQILAKIRRSTGHIPGDRHASYLALPRQYIRHGDLDERARVELFTDRLIDYGCGVHGCAEQEVSTAIHDILTDRGRARLVVGDNIPNNWLPYGFDFFQDRGLSFSELDRLDGVITRCALAIAGTGTIVLRHSPFEGRRALTLIPDYHLCCVFENQVVETVAQGFEELAGFDAAPLTTVSGPSATSDIEMTRIRGVHGPRILDILLIAP